MFDSVKDSGSREEFQTGSVRDTRDGKGRFDLISPIVTERDAKHLENGAKKYGSRNWEKGQPLSRFMDSAMRHLNKYMEGHRDEDHLAAARWNIAAIIHIEEMIRRGKMPNTLNDLPNYVEPAKAEPKDRFFILDGNKTTYWRYSASGEAAFHDRDGRPVESHFTPEGMLVCGYREVTEAEAKAHIGVKP